MPLTAADYDIVTRLAIGRGAFIYRARDKASGRDVVLKFLCQDDGLGDGFDLDALLADVPRLRSIKHEHICRLLDGAMDSEGPLLMYEYSQGVEGPTLPFETTLTAEQLLDIARQFVAAICIGESHQCPHGDLKPSNILFKERADGSPDIVVLDWGLAARRRSVPESSMPFLAPERLVGSPPSVRADLFSAGAVIYFLATRQAPIDAVGKVRSAAAWLCFEPESLGELRPDLPPPFVLWLTALLSLNPEMRPASAAAARDSLVTVADHGIQLADPRDEQERPPEPIPHPSARPQSVPHQGATYAGTQIRKVQGRGRNRTVEAAFVILLLLVALGVGSWAVSRKSAHPASTVQSPDTPAPSVSATAKPLELPAAESGDTATDENGAGTNRHIQGRPTRPLE